LRVILPAKFNYEEILDLKLDDYDISSVGIRLITSVPGRYTGNELYKYGQMRAYNIIFEEI
jgi:tyrosyl-DNA phosphodiesterase-1